MQNSTQWVEIGALDDLIPGTGAAVRVEGKQIAVFRTDDGLFALDNRDPFSDANVLSRGLTGDIAGRLVVASPVYKQHFCLKTGECLEDDQQKVQSYPVVERDGRVFVAAVGEA
ncbi:nitrite reductase small subunit NirD [Pseudohongiella sp.]|uniref:Rieske domain-containing protein n=1 Tax=marine sediment metagenome TaxID=412755 RepID=A0A0F9W6H9_9ZZZZ|nr:nitrite reductase small subunit NirD [Pseudohongiella sp.]HDZ09491.1 nitrite reductase small subunit NirD [Pseudohongiella sp.]HEA63937.1 nitrite reductase small subunit NirD [Pseudohongiella sp.]